MSRENEKINLKQWNFAKLQRYQLQNEAASIRLGLKTWNENKLRGTIYDHKSPESDFLSLYASQYDTVELHETFFEAPNPYDVQRWRKKVESINPNFRFCPIIPRVISHETALSVSSSHLTKLFYSLENFETHLGACILQLPETFAPTHISVLKKFLEQWPRELQIMIDFRHKAWFEQKTFISSLMKKNVGIFITDDIGQEKKFERFVTGENIGVRFIGRSKLGGDDQRLALWVYRMNEFGAMGIKDSYFFLYEQEEMCLGILQKMANSIGGKTRVPKGYNVQSDQLELFSEEVITIWM